MTIPARYLPIVARFRPQRETESDRQYLSAAIKSAKAAPLEEQERLVDAIMEADDDGEPDPR
jgi:hypothetical protein